MFTMFNLYSNINEIFIVYLGESLYPVYHEAWTSRNLIAWDQNILRKAENFDNI